VICAEARTLADGSVVLAPAATQPADLSACTLVSLSGSDLPSFTWVSVIPPADETSQVWAIGFVAVVGFWAVGVVVGQVLKAIKL